MNTNEELAKSLVSLIDETLEEIEELKKSKFSASEIKIEGPGDGVAGKPVNGELDAKKAEKEDDDKEDEDKDVKKSDDNDEDDKKDDKDDVKKADKEDEDEEKKDDKKEDMKKSAEVSEDLIKSYVDTRISPLEEKLSTIIDMVNKIGDQPVERKSVAAGAAPLKKSADDEIEPLSKSEVTNQLFELKKSGKAVDSLDIVKLDLGGQEQINSIANKYGLK